MTPVMKPIIVTITGPSSAGKTVLSKALEQSGFEPLVSTTTRAPRAGEVDGRDYHFVSKEKFLELLNTGGLIENVEYDSNYYGVQAAVAERAFQQGKPAVLVAEPHGCQQIHEFCSERGWTALRVFVNNPIPVLIDRMLKRFFEDVRDLNPDNPAQAQAFQSKVDSHGRRINKILGQEQEEWVKPAYDGTVKYDLIIDEFNNNQAEVVAMVQDVVAKASAEPSRRSPKP